jgi:hypothetical protein
LSYLYLSHFHIYIVRHFLINSKKKVLLNEISRKSLIAKGLGRPGRRKSLNINELGKL